MKKNRLLVGMICMSMAAVLLPLSAFAMEPDPDEEQVILVEEEQDETADADSFDDGDLDPDFEWHLFSEEVVITKYIGPGGEVVIPAYATWIDDEAFMGNETVTKVSFEKNSKCRLIGEKAFYGCTNLTEVLFPSSGDLSIIDYTFANSGLTSLSFSNDYTTFGNGSFKGCPIKSVTFPAKIDANAPDGVFVGCPIESITFTAGGQDFLPDDLFMNADLSRVDLVIPKWVKLIRNNTFANSNLKELRFESGSLLQTIGNESFANNPMTSVTFPENKVFEGILTGAFRNTKLVDVEIPASVTRLEYESFAGIKTLHSITNRSNTGGLFTGKSYISGNFVSVDEDELAEWEEYPGLEIYCYKDSAPYKFFTCYNEMVKKKYGSSRPEEQIPYIVIKELKGGKPDDHDDPVPVVVGGTYAVGQKFDITAEGFLGKSYAKYDIVPKGSAAVKGGIVTVSKVPADGKITITGLVKENKKDKKEKAFEFTAEKPAFSCGSKGVTFTRPYYADINPDDDKANVSGPALLTNTTLAPSKWISSKETVAAVDPATGLVMARSKGSAKITAVFGDPDSDKCAKYSFTVKVNIPKISKAKLTLASGASQTLKINGADRKSVITWSSSLPDHVFVEALTGRITALKYNPETDGKAVIQATIDGVAFPDYECEVTVSKPELTKSEIKLKPGKTFKIGLKNTKLKTTTGDITFTSSDTAIAEVDKTGKIKALAPGSAAITVNVAGIDLPLSVVVQ